jgi:hypothetical protein
MTEDERNLDMMVAELETENRLMRARNERLERELTVERNERKRMQDALERILAISRMAVWNGRPERVREVGPSKRHEECND